MEGTEWEMEKRSPGFSCVLLLLEAHPSLPLELSNCLWFLLFKQ